MRGFGSFNHLQLMHEGEPRGAKGISPGWTNSSFHPTKDSLFFSAPTQNLALEVLWNLNLRSSRKRAAIGALCGVLLWLLVRFFFFLIKFQSVLGHIYLFSVHSQSSTHRHDHSSVVRKDDDDDDDGGGGGGGAGAVESHLYMCTCSCQYICKSIHGWSYNSRGHPNGFTANVLVSGFPLWMCESWAHAEMKNMVATCSAHETGRKNQPGWSPLISYNELKKKKKKNRLNCRTKAT